MQKVAIVIAHGKGHVQGSNQIGEGAIVVHGRDVHYKPSAGGHHGGSQVTLPQQDGTYHVKLNGHNKLVLP